MTIAKELGYKRYFNVQELLFRIIGVDVTKKSVKHPYLLVIPALTFILVICLLSWKNRSDADKVIEMLAAGIDMVITTFKLTFFVLNQKKVLELIHNIWKMSKADDVEEHAMISDLNSKAYYICNTLVICGVGAFFAGTLSPPIMMVVIYGKTGKWIVAPNNADVFIESSEPWKYVFFHTGFAISALIPSTGALTIDTLYIWLVLNLMAQFRILNMRVKRTATLKTDTEINHATIQCIQFHQGIIEFAENFDLAYRSINFVQFAMGCIPLCFVGFQVTVGSGRKEFYVVYLLSNMFRMGLYCFLGQRIQDESYNVADNIYESFRWEKLSKISKQLLLITMTRAQKCCNLTGIFFVTNMSLFVWVYRTTTSYITILWTLAANLKL